MTTLVVLDRDALDRLGEDLGDRRLALGFAHRYCAMLTARVERILLALLRRDLVAAMDTVLSLKVSSTTVGTSELARLASDLEQDVRRRDVAAARLHAEGLAAAADRARSALTDHLAAHRAG